LQMIDEDIKFQTKQLKVRPKYKVSIQWRIIGMEALKVEIQRRPTSSRKIGGKK